MGGLKGASLRDLAATIMVMALSFGSSSGCAGKPDSWNEAFRRGHAANVASSGTNSIVIWPGTERIPFGTPNPGALNPQDVDAIATQCPDVIAAAPLFRERREVVFKNRSWIPSYIFGTTPAYLVVRDWQKLKEGAVFSEQEVRAGVAVCLVGQTIARELFQGSSPLGQQVRVGTVSFRVVGVLGKKGSDSIGMDQDDILLVPWTTVGKIRKTTDGQMNSIRAKAASSEKMSVAMQQIEQVLRQQHHIRPGQPNDFLVEDQIKSLEETAVLVHEQELRRSKPPAGPP